MAAQDIKVVLSASDKTKAAFDSAKRNMRGMEQAATNLRGTLGGITGGIVAGAFVAFAKNTLDAADALNDMSQRTGVAVKDLASLRTVAEQNGTSLESVGKAVSKLNLSFSQAQGGSKEIIESLKRLGVNSGDARERFFQLADAYAKAGDKTRVLADIQKVLGRGYAEMIPLLAQGGTELRRAADASESFADAMARLAPDADKFNDNMAELKTNVAGLMAAGLADLVPIINDIAEAMKAAYEESGFFKAAIVGLGGIGTAIFTDEFKSDLAKLEKLKKQLADIESLPLPGLVASQSKRDQMRAEIARLEASVVAAQAAAIKAAEAKAKQGTPGNTPLPTGGTAKADPLSSFFKSTDTAKLKEYNTLTAELLRRMAGAKGDTTIYVQALDEINKKYADVIGLQQMKDALGTGSFFATDPETIKFIQDQQEAINELNAIVPEAEQRFQSMLAAADFTKLKQDQEDMIILVDKFNAGLLTEAEYLDLVKNRLGLVGEEAEKAKSFADELGLVFESAMQGAIRSGGDFQDVLKGLATDVIQLVAQMLILEPVLKSIKKAMGASSAVSSGGGFNFGSLFSDFGSWFSGLFSFANGGIMTSAGPLPLNKYAIGGIANSPQLAMFGEGSRPEAYVPLPDGRRIPVQMSGGGGGQVINNITIKTDDPAAVRASRGQLLADISNQMQRANRWR